MSSAENQRPDGRRRRMRTSRLRQASQPAAKKNVAEAPPQMLLPPTWSPRTTLVIAGIALLAGIWSYWPTLCELVATWEREPDYSHGYLVMPVALLFLWLRRASFPGLAAGSMTWGLGLLAVCFGLRAIDALFFFEFLDGYSLLPWAAAVVALIFSAGVLRWALPSIGFLFFMIPIPFSAETALSQPLQRVATKLSCAALQLLGQPAFAEGNVILLDTHELEVAQACSGLRLFMSVVALAYCYIVLIRRPAWEKAFLVAMVAPIAIVSNSLRIVATGMLYQYVSSEVARKFAHDFAGWAMIPVAAALFGSVLWYLASAMRDEEVVPMGMLVRKVELGSPS